MRRDILSFYITLVVKGKVLPVENKVIEKRSKNK